MGSLCLFLHISRLLKWGYFYWLHVKSSNHLHTKLNLGYLKGTKFYLESKASFIDISSIASFKPFLIAWLREYWTFSDSSVVNLKFSPWPNTPSWEPFSEKKTMFYYQTFFLFKHVLHYAILSKYLKKKIGRHRAYLRVSRLLKWGIFTGYALKVRITFIQN